jgi:methionine-rich copper-binding protein CopC
MRRGALRAGLAAALLLAPAAAGAHAVLVRSLPAPRATLPRAPERVELTFNERIEAVYSTASVWDAAGRRVDRRDAAVAAADPKRLVVSVAALAPGVYTVRYRVLSVDGHLADGSYAFTVGPR